jgi:hypothetical protein
MATTAPEPSDADAETAPIEVVGDPQDWQKRVSAAKVVPHDGQKLICSSRKNDSDKSRDGRNLPSNERIGKPTLGKLCVNR